MSIEDAIKKAMAGDFGSQAETPVSDKASEIFRSKRPFKERWDLISALEAELDQTNTEDCSRYGSIIEGMHADAETADDIRHMNAEASWQE